MTNIENILDLQGQNAFVTGAGQGAGRGIALMLAHHNAGGVAVNDYVTERAEAVAAEIEAAGFKAVAVQADVGDYASVKAAHHKASSALGPITLLVNNAGNAGPDAQMRHSPLFWETDPSDWPRYFRTNLDGVMNCCHVALPGMVKEKRGRIVTVVSDSGRVGEARLAAYAAAKAGAAGFVRSLAKEAGRFGITSNAISLSTLEPPMPAEDLEAFLASDRTKAQLAQYTIRRFGKADDVAAMALFLCSEAASWITGQTYPVNGGYSFAV
ncbi:SDR family oxidoreductase [Novosphingobium sp. ST904]|uniref:SDR family NAD(P)-dependent oxidoreductase n=1 Tax=Novosphingobium sp. ST904 TaxID=1684385 RepID=UPI0006C84C6B|nr:SDR family oxidoreductase [Novosphingobium sp. ST904]KPH66084.1 oxidoreductase [Novosphingobium sp. ST904]TCM27772.1 3-oxoacyl-[acyl-carrier protein] reductase [Novosphingobium sp. ST904]